MNNVELWGGSREIFVKYYGFSVVKYLKLKLKLR